jgi:hypothetical protein
LAQIVGQLSFPAGRFEAMLPTVTGAALESLAARAVVLAGIRMPFS